MGKRDMPKYRLGIDLGGTKMHAVVINRKGKVLGSARRATKPEDGYKAVLRRLVDTADEAAEDAELDLDDFDAIGLGMPGPIDDRRGMVHLAPNLGWRERSVADDLKRVIKRPVVLGNDVNFGCLGEVTHGCANGSASAFAAFVGTGLGGGVVLNGRLENGLHGFAGEIGHVPAPFGDAACACGLKGCLETSASKTGIIRLILEEQRRGTKSLIRLKKGDRLKSSQLREAWKRRCPATRAAVARSCRALGWGLGAVAGVIDPEVFVLGGGVMEAMGDELLPLVRDGMTEFSMCYRERKPDLRLAALGDDAVAIGAAVASAAEE
ncbi:MAG: ROK family protein [Planctomycetes bacterium]|jgi:glucokinase|nr:ROK family protein [Planctomycetota bacterium]